MTSAGGFSLLAPAKINLTLRVTGRRPDGYHELESLVVFAEVGDRLHFAPCDDVTLELRGPFAGALSDPADNLILRAAARLAERFNASLGAAIVLEKALPVASGIGGGSADAAAALVGLDQLWRLGIERRELAKIALSLGADVPVCLAGTAAWVTGIGEGIEPLPGLPSLPAVLVNPGRPVSTAAVFAARRGPFSPSTQCPTVTDRDRLVGWLRDGGNDLEAPARALQPEIGRVLEALACCSGCRLVRMSGSGATCFGLFDATEEAHAAAREIAGAEPDWWVRATTLGVSRQARDTGRHTGRQ